MDGLAARPNVYNGPGCAAVGGAQDAEAGTVAAVIVAGAGQHQVVVGGADGDAASGQARHGIGERAPAIAAVGRFPDAATGCGDVEGIGVGPVEAHAVDAPAQNAEIVAARPERFPAWPDLVELHPGTGQRGGAGSVAEESLQVGRRHMVALESGTAISLVIHPVKGEGALLHEKEPSGEPQPLGLFLFLVLAFDNGPEARAACGPLPVAILLPFDALSAGLVGVGLGPVAFEQAFEGADGVHIHIGRAQPRWSGRLGRNRAGLRR